MTGTDEPTQNKHPQTAVEVTMKKRPNASTRKNRQKQRMIKEERGQTKWRERVEMEKAVGHAKKIENK